MAYKSSPRGSRPVTLIAIHTAEGARTARSLAAYFFREDIRASSHSIIDAGETLHVVPFGRASWTLRSGNPISDNLEICGFAGWNRQQWLSTGTVDGCVNPRKMLHRTSAWIRWRCLIRNIPVRRLTVTQLRAGMAGAIAHDDWTKAFRDGTHWDPGPGFPWDVVISEAQGQGEDMPLNEADLNKIESIVDGKMRQGVRYIDNGDPGSPYEGHTTKKIRQEIEEIREMILGAPSESSLRQMIREELAGNITLTPAREDPEPIDSQ